jgi:hypothetical protein
MLGSMHAARYAGTNGRFIIREVPDSSNRRDGSEREHRDADGGEVTRGDIAAPAGDHPARDDRHGRADREPGHHDTSGIREGHRHDTAPRRAERHADTDLAGAAGEGIGHNSIQADGRAAPCQPGTGTSRLLALAAGSHRPDQCSWRCLTPLLRGEQSTSRR